MRELSTTTSSFLAAIALASAVCLAVPGNPLAPHFAVAAASAADGAASPAPRAAWSASATGRVEPKSGPVSIGTQSPGRVADVAVKVNDVVKAGDTLVRLEDDDLLTRVAAAATEVQVRERERDEEVVKGLALERRQAEDSVAAAERALYRARLSFDDVAFRVRTGSSGTVADVEKARFAIQAAREQLANSRGSLIRATEKPGMPLATRLESSVATVRAELSLAEAAVERTRIRAPTDGTVLSVNVKYGELVAPSPDAPVVVFGDLRGLRVKAEVEERDASKVRIGQKAVVKGDAFPDLEFTGTVTSISQMLASPRIATRGVRRPNDIEVLEVMVALDGTPPLLTGMRVDVFFKGDAPDAAAAVSPAAGAPKTN
jgi:HlyD family secretion protein